jgi:hypothetical protein
VLTLSIGSRNGFKISRGTLMVCKWDSYPEKSKRLTLLESPSFIVSGASLMFLDLYGLLVFLHVLPYSHKTWWERLLFWPYIRHGDALPLINLLSQIFWRNAKSDVADEVP